MKILHTGDWHIGKLVHGVHMTDDQRYILKKLKELIENKKPQVLIVAGDLYDRSIPPTEAVELLDEIFSELIIDNDIKIIAIAGNHDSPDRVEFASKLLNDRGLYITGNLKDTIKPIVIEDEYGPVEFYPIPYAEPVIVRELYDDQNIKNHDTAMKAIINVIDKSRVKESRRVCISHAFVMGTDTLETSESERPLSIGGSEYVSVDYFKDFNYVALGHLHRAQKVKYDYVRYSGSLLKYSFSEAKQKKSVTLVDLDENGNVEVELISLDVKRDMRVIKGEIETLLDEEIYSCGNTKDYIMATLTDRGELIDPLSKLRAIYPNILRLEKEDINREAGVDKTSASKEFSKKSPIELFEEFYENMSGEEFSEEKKNVFKNIVDNN